MSKKRLVEGLKSLQKQKNAQVTLFIIVGLVILASVGLYFYLTAESQKETIDIPEITENIPAEMQAVRRYVEQCVETTATDAVRLIGMHGGYIGVDADSLQYTGKSFAGAQGSAQGAISEPTSSDVLGIDGSGEWSVPYWYYMSSDNAASSGFQFGTAMPPLRKADGSGYVEEQMEKFVNANLRSCLLDFAPLEQRGFTVTETGEISTKAVIAYTDIVVFVTYPLSASI